MAYIEDPRIRLETARTYRAPNAQKKKVLETSLETAADDEEEFSSIENEDHAR